jgi:hypothetical protein
MTEKITERVIFSQIQVQLRTEHILDQIFVPFKSMYNGSRKQSANNAALKAQKLH